MFFHTLESRGSSTKLDVIWFSTMANKCHKRFLNGQRDTGVDMQRVATNKDKNRGKNLDTKGSSIWLKPFQIVWFPYQKPQLCHPPNPYLRFIYVMQLLTQLAQLDQAPILPSKKFHMGVWTPAHGSWCIQDMLELLQCSHHRT